MTALLVAAPGIPVEPTLVAQAPSRGLAVRRRCVDTVDLLAAAAVEPGLPVVLSAALPRLSADAVTRLGRGRVLVGLAVTDADQAQLRALGVPLILDADQPVDDLLDRIVDAACAPMPGPPTDAPRSAEPATGLLVAVWGPIGSPGRTTVALGLAEAIAASGRRVCLVDADTYAPSIALALGIVEDTSGLVVACRHAEVGRLSPPVLAGSVRSLTPTWHVLSGLPTAGHWAEVRAGGLERLWDTCRSSYDVTVVDTGFCLEVEEDGVWARGRNAAATTAVATADRVVAVADAAPTGVVRLAAEWPRLTALTGGDVVVARNRVEDRGRDWQDVARAAGVRAPVRPLPADRRAVRTCWAKGRGLVESRSRSPLRRAVGELAEHVVSG